MYLPNQVWVCRRVFENAAASELFRWTLDRIANLQTTTMDNFPLKWRWTDPKYCVLSDEELALIEPLDPLSANSMWEKSLSFLAKGHDFLPSSEIFDDIESIECSEPHKVIMWLKSKIQPEKIIVSWQPETHQRLDGTADAQAP